jgi:hypothetical protein
MPTTLQEALQIIQQLRAENAVLTQQVDELTTRLTHGECKNAAPQIKALGEKIPAKPRRKRAPQHNRGQNR